MNFSKELIEKAKTAKSAEELLAMAKAENVELTAEQAAKVFEELNKTGELSDEELDNVAGGTVAVMCGDQCEVGWANTKEEVIFRFSVGQYVEVFDYGKYTYRARIYSIEVKEENGRFRPSYTVERVSDGKRFWVGQEEIENPNR